MKLAECLKWTPAIRAKITSSKFALKKYCTLLLIELVLKYIKIIFWRTNEIEESL